MSEIISNYVVYNYKLMLSQKVDTSVYNDCTSVYEVLRVINGVPLFFNDHYSRFLASVKLANLNVVARRNIVLECIVDLCKACRISTGNIKLVWHVPTNGQTADSLMYFIEHNYPTSEQYEQGVSVKLFDAERSLPNAKIINRNLRQTADAALHNEHVYELVYVNRFGHITEGSRSNIFFIKNNRVVTAPEALVLPGISRKYALKACIADGIEVEERNIPTTELADMQAAFISGTSPHILPIRQLNNIQYNAQHPVLKRVMAGFEQLLQENLAAARLKTQ